MRKIDMHVHLVGNAHGGHGCWLRVTPGKRLLFRFMLRQIGLPMSALLGDLDTPYVERLLQWIRTSSLDAVVLLAQEAVCDDDGRLLRDCGNAYVPNSRVLELARRHPEFLPAISIHPARRDAMEELEQCLAGGAVMMKYLPNCQNINCNDRRFTPFWQRMAQAGLPLLAHTGGERTLQVVRPEYADPRILRLPLECGVTCIAAHAASPSTAREPNYFPVLAQMMRDHPRLYADTSALNLPHRSKVLRDCLRPEILPRLVHGSDYPVPVQTLWPWLRGVISRGDMLRCARIANPIERDYQLKVATGFPPETFTRINQLLRQP